MTRDSERKENKYLLKIYTNKNICIKMWEKYSKHNDNVLQFLSFLFIWKQVPERTSVSPGTVATPVFLPGKSHGQRILGATVHAVTKSQTQLSDWTAAADTGTTRALLWDTAGQHPCWPDLSLLRTLQGFGFRTTRGSVHADKSLVSQDLLWEVPPEGKGHPPNRRQSNSWHNFSASEVHMDSSKGD